MTRRGRGRLPTTVAARLPTPAALIAALAVATALLTTPTAVARPAQPPAPCAAVALFAVPGTTETAESADPAVPVGRLAGLTVPLTQRWAPDRLRVEYLPYPASLDRPPYLLSEARGIEALTRVTTAYAARCPSARIVLVGYSQGADVVSDLVHRASRGTVGLDPARIAGAVMLGSPRRDPRAPNLVAAPGRGLLGPRPTRELDVYRGRVYEVCAVGDPICATDNLDLGRLREGLASGAHRSYPTLPVGPDRQPLYAVLGAAVDRLVAAADPAPT